VLCLSQQQLVNLFMRYIICFLILAPFLAFVQDDMVVKTKSAISTGEKLEYRMYLGIFTVGKGTTTVDKELHSRNEKQCFKVDAYMETSGMATWISKVNDNWGAYIDANEIITHGLDKAYVQVADKTTGKLGEPKEYATPDNVRDIVAGFMYLRIIDFSKHKLRDTITVSGFFEDTSYKFKILYFGTETVSTGLGKFPCHKLVPIMPKNSLFRGENSVTAWISADGNQIPVKVDAKMFVGHAGTELTSFRGLRNQVKIIR
jgi:Protein of unknown function (DUF3108)